MINNSFVFILAFTLSIAAFADTSTKKAQIVVSVQRSTLVPEGEKVETICNFKGPINFYDGQASFPRISEADVMTFSCNYKGREQNLKITVGAFASTINSKFINNVVPSEIFGPMMLKAVFPILLVTKVDEDEEFQSGISTVIGTVDLKTTSLFGSLSPEVSETCDINGENCESSRPFFIKASFLVTDL
jgi:hypothetical protein